MNLRERARAALPERAFLRRDRGSALFVSNAPAFGRMGPVKGFRAETSGGLTRLYVEPALLEECGYAPDALAESLERFRGTSEDAAALFSDIMKALDGGGEEVPGTLDRRLRQEAARAMRAGGGEGLYYCALALAELNRKNYSDGGNEK